MKLWVSVDIINHSSGAYQILSHPDHYKSVGISDLNEESNFTEYGYYIFNGSAEFLNAAFNEKFDFVFSVNCFEHVSNLSLILNKIYYSLKKNGQLFTEFGPIYSCSAGSHFWVTENFNFNKPSPLRPWEHLLSNKTELDFFLDSVNMSKQFRHDVLYQFYESNFINRLFYEDYVKLLNLSSFNDFKIEDLWPESIDSNILEILHNKYPNNSNFTTYGLRVIANK